MKKIIYSAILSLLALCANAQTFDVLRLSEGHSAKFGSTDIKWNAPQDSDGTVVFDMEKKLLVISGVSELIDGSYLFPDAYVPNWKKPSDKKQASDGVQVLKGSVKKQSDGQPRFVNMFRSHDGIMTEMVIQMFSGCFRLELTQRMADDNQVFSPEAIFKPLPDLGYRKKGYMGYAGLHYGNISAVGVSVGQGAFLNQHVYLGGGLKAEAPTFDYEFTVGKFTYRGERYFLVGPYVEFREYFLKSRVTPVAGVQAGFYALYSPDELVRKWGAMFDASLLVGANWSIGDKSGLTLALTWSISRPVIQGFGLALFLEF